MYLPTEPDAVEFLIKPEAPPVFDDAESEALETGEDSASYGEAIGDGE